MIKLFIRYSRPRGACQRMTLSQTRQSLLARTHRLILNSTIRAQLSKNMENAETVLGFSFAFTRSGQRFYVISVSASTPFFGILRFFFDLAFPKLRPASEPHPVFLLPSRCSFRMSQGLTTVRIWAGRVKAKNTKICFFFESPVACTRQSAKSL